MQTLKVIIEIAVNDDDANAVQAKDIIQHAREDDDCSLFIGDSEFVVISASLD